jgi:hypothetical protein
METSEDSNPEFHMEIGENIRKVKDLDLDLKEERYGRYKLMFRRYGSIPELLERHKSEDLWFYLGHNRRFCELAQIDYAKIDDHKMDYILALCMHYVKKLNRNGFP